MGKTTVTDLRIHIHLSNEGLGLKGFLGISNGIRGRQDVFGFLEGVVHFRRDVEGGETNILICRLAEKHQNAIAWMTPTCELKSFLGKNRWKRWYRLCAVAIVFLGLQNTRRMRTRKPTGETHHPRRTYNPIFAPTASINVHACWRAFSSCEMDSFPRVFSHKSWTCWGMKYGLCSLTVEMGIPIPDSVIFCAEA
jgi:hypothetical protein